MFVDAQNNNQPYYMGCYGIGIERTLATVIEMHNNEKGMIWPDEIAPFKFHLLGLNLEDEDVKHKAHTVYKKM